MTDLRVSDQERDQVAGSLREHFAAGRITQDELNDRVQAAYAARTQRQLQALLGDLPALPVSQQQLRAELAERRHHLQRRLLQEAGGAATPFVICTIIWMATGAQGGFWPAFVAIPLILLLVRNGWRLYGPSPELDRVERELEARARHGGRRRGGHRRPG
ncbi:MAG TPA: DUF1707 domain-containing protein [Solirubrobacteraceae bacterium]|nr:DUF1707 domain-containing protein [Solirubrobacteraceae bacterium]